MNNSKWVTVGDPVSGEAALIDVDTLCWARFSPTETIGQLISGGQIVQFTAAQTQSVDEVVQKVASRVVIDNVVAGNGIATVVINMSVATAIIRREVINTVMHTRAGQAVIPVMYDTVIPLIAQYVNQ